MLRVFNGAEWVGHEDGPKVLLLHVSMLRGGNWLYVYSVSPGTRVQVVTCPAPGQMDPRDPDYAAVVLSMIGRQA
jgi:hypothetical protein